MSNLFGYTAYYALGDHQMTTVRELLEEMACHLDVEKNKYPQEADRVMASLIVERLHDQAEALDQSLKLTNEDKFNCAGFAGADTHSGGD